MKMNEATDESEDNYTDDSDDQMDFENIKINKKRKGEKKQIVEFIRIKYINITKVKRENKWCMGIKSQKK